MNSNIIQILSQDPRLTFNKLANSGLHDQVMEISQSLNSKNARQILYHIAANHVIVPNCPCGSKLKWNADVREYRQYCSRQCVAQNTVDLRILANLKKYGTEWFTQTDEYLQKVQSTSLLKNGTSHHTQTPQWKQKVKQSINTKYGVDSISQLPSIKKKTAHTNHVIYGSASPNGNAAVAQRIKTTNLIKYGGPAPSSAAVVREKMQNTMLQRYGSKHAVQSPELLNQIIATRRSERFDELTLEKWMNTEWLSQQHNSGRTIFSIADELGLSHSYLAKWFHSENIPIIRHSKTHMETLLISTLSPFTTVQYGNRTVLNGREIDIWLPDINLGIEINGLYWHTESQGRGRDYHVSKSQQAQMAGVELWQFWDYELDNTQIFDILISKIRNKLKLSTKLHARKLTICEISGKTANEFYTANHIQGSTAAQHHIALLQGVDVMACMSFGKSRFTDKFSWELNRFASHINAVVMGGANKILSYFAKTHARSGETLVSYCDRRYSQGSLYSVLGFDLLRINKPGFFYTDNGKYLGSRYQYQKHNLPGKLLNYNHQLTGDENMANHGYDKVWDCGQLVWLKTFK